MYKPHADARARHAVARSLGLSFLPTLCSAMLLTLAVSAAQEPEPSSAEVTEKAPDAAPNTRGDTIVLENGKTLAGMQVVRTTPWDYYVRICEGVELRVPRSMVKSIEFDDITPELESREDENGKPDPPRLLDGRKVPRDVYSKMQRDISTPPLEPDASKDLAVLLPILGRRADLTVVILEGLKKLPPDKRTWDGALKEGTSLWGVLDARKELDWHYAPKTGDAEARILVGTAAEMAKQAESAEEEPGGKERAEEDAEAPAESESGPVNENGAPLPEPEETPREPARD